MPLAPRRMSAAANRRSSHLDAMSQAIADAACKAAGRHLPSFSVSTGEAELISSIADRYIRLCRDHGWQSDRKLHIIMDITACHANGCRIRLSELLVAEPFDLTHDVAGIGRHIDRATGQLTQSFVPRYAALERAS